MDTGVQRPWRAIRLSSGQGKRMFAILRDGCSQGLAT